MKMKVSVAIESELVERLDKIAAISKQSRSQIIERMVREQIMTTEQFANLMANPEARAVMIRQMADPKVMGPVLRAMGDKPSKRVAQQMAENAERFGNSAEQVKKGNGKKP